jgi:hypothetical protein
LSGWTATAGTAWARALTGFSVTWVAPSTVGRPSPTPVVPPAAGAAATTSAALSAIAARPGQVRAAVVITPAFAAWM